MRTSKRDRIITGALELAHRDGFDALTFDALAERVGLTRGGVIYHFRTKTELLEGIAAAFQERWRAEALEALGKPLEEANRTERIEALARSVLDGEILPGEVSFILSSTPQAETIKNAWDMLRDEWIGEVDELSAMQRVALLAVDGWWANRAVDSRSRNPDEPAIAELIVSLARGEASDGGRQ
ncbi:TetR/AcrR family transcriptional regulator [Actinomyces oris]|mgnify:FL=1|uniref:TetR/AcrR family transcriptional regulator n=1 Tax=Actinomyces oris TaxID=544580 RepID=UPI00242C9B4B|nr:TetR/AcrR family transcriptional regulator [Actinomyces oris]